MALNRFTPRIAASTDKKLADQPMLSLSLSTASPKPKNYYQIRVAAKNSLITYFYFKKMWVNDEQLEWVFAGVDLYKILCIDQYTPFPHKLIKKLSKISEKTTDFGCDGNVNLAIPMTADDINLILDAIISTSDMAIRDNALELRQQLISRNVMTQSLTWAVDIQSAEKQTINLPHPILWLQTKAESIITPEDINLGFASASLKDQHLISMGSSQEDEDCSENETSTMLTRAIRPNLGNHGFFSFLPTPMEFESCAINLKCPGDDVMDYSSEISKSHQKNERELKNFLEQSFSQMQKNSSCFFAFDNLSKKEDAILKRDFFEEEQKLSASIKSRSGGQY